MDTRNKMEAVKVFVGKEDIDRNRYRDKDRRRILMNEIWIGIRTIIASGQQIIEENRCYELEMGTNI